MPRLTRSRNPSGRKVYPAVADALGDQGFSPSLFNSDQFFLGVLRALRVSNGLIRVHSRFFSKVPPIAEQSNFSVSAFQLFGISSRVSSHSSPGARFRAALAAERPLQIAGAVNAYAALLAQRAGFRALYLSGAGVANHSYGIPDIGDTELADVVIDVRRITQRIELPLLVDIDTGWDDPAAAVAQIAAAGAAAIHIEDQVPAKLCGHLPGKQLVLTTEMVARVKAAVGGKPDSDFVVMARTDAASVEGLPAAITRAQAYVAAGADAIFAEAFTTLADYKTFVAAVTVPVLANLTEFGKTPLFTLIELRDAGVAMALYPLSASRAAAQASLQVYTSIRRDGTQRDVISTMQTRADLYTTLGYTPPM
jgi:methylisocitrate lyase